MGDPENPFFKEKYRQVNLEKNEVAVAMELPLTLPDGSEFYQAFKQSRRRDDDLAIVNAAMRVRFSGAASAAPASRLVTEASFAFGGMAPFTKLAKGLVKFWIGKAWTHENMKASLEVLAADLPLPDDVPGGMAEYRRTLAKSFFFKFWLSVAHQLGDGSLAAPCTERDLGAALSHTTLDYHHEPVKGLQHYARDQKTLRQAIGAPNRHMAADVQAAGFATYTDDIEAGRGELYMDFVLSTKAHAKVLSIDDSRAKTIEGYVALITAKDVKGENWLGPIAHDEEALASEEVNSVGSVIAAVCSKSRYGARMAAKAVEVTYEELPAIVSLEDAVEKESFHKLLFMKDPNEVEAEIHTVRDEKHKDKGMDSLFASLQADPETYLIVEGESFIGGQEHFYLETNATRVEPGENGEYVITTSCQNLHETQLLCSKALGVD